MPAAVHSLAQTGLVFHLADVEVQHRRLFELVQEVVDSVRNPAVRFHTTCNCFARLCDYTRLHFADEEQFMMENNYPEVELRVHQAVHAAFLDKLTIAHREFCNGVSTAPGRIEQMFREWFEAHHVHEDQAYIDFFRTRVDHRLHAAGTRPCLTPSLAPAT